MRRGYRAKPSFAGLQREVYLSIIDRAAWRLYREGMHASLVEELYTWDYKPEALYEPLVTTVIAFCKSAHNTPGFQARLAKALQPSGNWTGMGMGEFGMYTWDPSSRSWLSRPGHTLPGIDLNDEHQFAVVLLAVAVAAYFYSSENAPSQNFHNALSDHTLAVRDRLAPLWFEVCDTAIGFDGQGVVT